MTFRFNEARESRSSKSTPPSETRIYFAAGSTNETYVYGIAITTGSPSSVAHSTGTLYRNDVQIDPVGYALWKVTVTYGQSQKEAGSYSISFDTTGGTIHITNSLETVNKYTAPGKPAAADMGGAIGVSGDEVSGTEIVIPSLKLTVDFRHPEAEITLAHIKNLARWTGKTNSGTFLTFEEGEVLFLGATGREGTDTETDVSYQFACSENLINQTIGDVVEVDKKGWEHAWIWYEDAAVGGVPVKRPRWVYVERVYEAIDMATLLGFGD